MPRPLKRSARKAKPQPDHYCDTPAKALLLPGFFVISPHESHTLWDDAQSQDDALAPPLLLERSAF
ncbi:hypothetical protein KL86DES1_20315 [uncultured Desulfovibrio sp.]|uniref:Uncharacterized protein n=1 Tax=uncultured Desulfovibrio sp. TaxID=167968 RepID=A0A212L362_9BACT|nr:hypothetical protein KL86DES1_20315 [uncultured Desulfovibrio sp.]VZH33217.1 conserved protein of unknown function [Desulfovibrio sp. 86]